MEALAPLDFKLTRSLAKGTIVLHSPLSATTAIFRHKTRKQRVARSLLLRRALPPRSSPSSRLALGRILSTCVYPATQQVTGSIAPMIG
eukprot:scaffold3481_cov315-Pinguiococcus_pyrenoidosus.AAC.3